MKQFIFGLKIFSFLIISTIISLIIIFFLFYLSNLPQKYAVQFIEYYAKNNFNTSLKIRNISGNIFSNFSLDDIECFNPNNSSEKIFEINKATLHYNPFKAIINYNNILQSIDFLGIENMDYFITREKNGKFQPITSKTERNNNITNFSNLKLKQKIIISNLNIIYTDERGWKKKTLDNPFSRIVSNINGEISFKKNIGKIELKGIMEESNKPLNLSGHVDVNDSSYKLNFDTKQLNLSNWSSYTVPDNQIEISGDHVDIDGYIKNTNPKEKNNFPILFAINIHPKNASLKLPFLENTITNINGKISILNSEITPHILKSYDNRLTKTEQTKILKELNNNNILKNNEFTNETTKNFKTFDSKSFNKKTIQKIISKKAIHLQIDSIDGLINNINVNAKGPINLKDSSIYLKLVSTPFESKYLEEFVPAIKPININNPIVINMTIFNSLMNPITRGKATAKTLSVLDFNFTDVKSDFKLTPKEFNLDIKKAIFNDGQILGSISTEFSATNTTLSGTIFGSTINTAKTLPLENNMTTGNFDIELAINGDNNELITSINCYSTTTSIANQKINTIETRLVSNELGNNFEKTKLYINNGLEPIYIESILTQNQQILIVDGSTIPFNDIISDPTNTIAELTTMSTLTIPIKNNAPQYNFNDIKTEFFISIENGSLLNTRYENLTISGLTEKSTFSIKSFNLINKSENINGNGTFTLTSPNDININIKNVALTNLPIIEGFIPISVQPLTGKLNASLAITKNKKSATKFIDNLNVTGYLDIIDGVLAKEQFNKLSTNFMWNKKLLTIKTFNINDGITNINLNGNLSDQNNIKLNFLTDSKIKLNQLAKLFNLTLLTDGIVNFTGNINGNLNDPTINISFSSDKILIDHINLEKTLGKFNYTKENLTIDQASLFTANGNVDFNGKINLNTITEFDKAMTLKFNFNNLELENIQKALLIPPKITINNGTNRLINNQKEDIVSALTISVPFNKGPFIKIYSNIDDKNTLEFINKINLLLEEKEKIKKDTLKINSGNLSGLLDIKLQKNKIPNINSGLSISNLNSSLINAKNMSLTSFPQRNKLIYSFEINTGLINNKPINQLKLNGHIAKNFNFVINSTRLNTNTVRASDFINGYINLPILSNTNNEHPIKLDIHLNENELDILSLFTEEIEEIIHKEPLKLKVSGSLEKPIINTKESIDDDYLITLNDTNPLSKQIKLNELDLKIKNNLLEINDINLDIVKNPNATNTDNTVKVNGVIGIEQLNLKLLDNLIITTNLKTKNETINLNITDFIDSNVTVDEVNISGPFTIPLNSFANTQMLNQINDNNFTYPVIDGTVKLNDSTILIINSASSTPIPVEYNLDIFVENNNEIITTLLGNNLIGISTDLSLSENNTPIYLSGNSFNPLMTNRVNIKDANLSLLSKEFNLMSEQEQNIFTTIANLENADNTIEFQTLITEENKEEINPKLNLKAMSIIENSPTENYFVIMKVDDSILELKEINFDVFKSTIPNPSNSSDLEFVNSYAINNASIQDQTQIEEDDTNEFIQLLYPTLYKEISEGRLNESLTEIGKTQVNTLLRRNFIRPLERELSKRAGLDDFKINYNVGKQLFEENSDNQTIGIQVIKQLISDQLLLRVKTNLELFSEDNEETETFEFSEIELTYYLLKNDNLSFNIAQIKDDEIQDSYDTKTSLRYRYEY